MNNLYKRPMFRKGGSAEGGITSGLQSPRQGYNIGQRVTDVMGEMKTAMPQRAPKRNFNDFLINFGLDIASRSPQGNIFQTAALSAKDPYEKFSKARDVESNLMRQVGMESEIMDINKENAAAAAAAKDASAMSRLEKQIQADKDLYNLEKGENLNALITARAQESIADGKFNNYNAATNEAEWTFRGSTEYKDRNIGGVLSEKQANDPKTRNKFAKSQVKKNKGTSVNRKGSIYYDPYNNQVLEAVVVDGEYILRPVGGSEEVVDTTTAVVEDTPSYMTEENPSYRRPPKNIKDLQDKAPPTFDPLGGAQEF